MAYGLEAAAAYIDCKYGFVVVVAAAVGGILSYQKGTTLQWVNSILI
jgi:hypothetical protein